jgi:hypothetical protein
MDKQFWGSPSKWPRDTHDYVFLARAFDQIGRARFGEEWIGSEAVTDHVWQPATRKMVMPSAFEKPYSSQPREMDVPVGPPAQATPESQGEVVNASIRRRMVVVDFIINQCSAGTLRSVVKDSKTSLIKRIPSHHWDVDNIWPRFSCCRMNPDQPGDNGIWGDKYHPIFIERDSLEKVLASQPFAVKPAELDIHLSPYMKLMLHVIRKWEITPENQYTKDALEAAMKEEWTGSIELSDRLAQAMATLVRKPESQGGRALKRPVRPKGATQKR